MKEINLKVTGTGKTTISGRPPIVWRDKLFEFLFVLVFTMVAGTVMVVLVHLIRGKPWDHILRVVFGIG